MNKVLLFALLLSPVGLTQAMDLPRKNAPHAPVKKQRTQPRNLNGSSKAKKLGSEVAKLFGSEGSPTLVSDEEIQQVIEQINTGIAFTQILESRKQQ